MNTSGWRRILWALLALQFVGLAWERWGRCGHFQIDSYQSAYCVMAIARGELPYRDFAYYFGALPLYPLAAAVSLSGAGLQALYACGILHCALLMLLLRAWLASLGFGLGLQWCSLCLFLHGFAFNNLQGTRLFNFVMPYCHSSTFAVTFLLLALLGWQSPTRVWLWGLASAALLLTRLELGLWLLLVSGWRQIWMRLNRSQLALYWGLALGPSLLIYGIWAWQAGLEVLLRENLFWAGHLPQNNPHQRQILGANLESLGRTLSLFGVRLVTLVLGGLLYRRLPWSGWGALVALVQLSWSGVEWALADLQCWLLLACFWSWRCRHPHFFACLLSLGMLGRIFLDLNFSRYFFYLGLIPLWALAAGLLFLALRTRWQGFVASFLGSWMLFLALGWGWLNSTYAGQQRVEVVTSRGHLYLYPTYLGKAFARIVRELDEIGVEGKKVWVLPEGAMLNVLTGSRHPFYHATALPHSVAAWGESRWISGLEAAQPDYVVALHRWGQEFSGQHFGRDYAPELWLQVRRQYQEIGRWGPTPFVVDSYEGGGAILFKRRTIGEL